ncbi:MAG: hypothetical protein H6551_08645 [Chitinophagales bacterium]|nr:hypothetical protein [Chitinophagaceae bacterium]MCB9065189.1 hypothetical protein [Chitinophagales bacterium]
MNKTLLTHFTFTDIQTEEVDNRINISDERLSDLVRDLKHLLIKAESELLSPRRETIDRLLLEA